MTDFRIVQDDSSIFDRSDEILERAKKKFKEILVIGIDENGVTFSDTNMENSHAIFSMEHVKFNLFASANPQYDDYEDEE